MDFNNKVRAVVDIFGVEVWITETLVNTWIIMAILIIGALVLRKKFFKNLGTIPKGAQNVIEAIVDGMQSFAKGVLGKDYLWLDKWFFTVVTFIAASMLSGLINLRPPTADIATTLALSMATFFLINLLGIMANPKKYAKGLFEPIFIFLPVNIIGKFAIPISLGFRLFGNALAGVIIMGLYYGLIPRYLSVVIPVPLHAYFDVFAGLIQAYIFTMLSMSFIGNEVSED